MSLPIGLTRQNDPTFPNVAWDLASVLAIVKKAETLTALTHQISPQLAITELCEVLTRKTTGYKPPEVPLGTLMVTTLAKHTQNWLTTQAELHNTPTSQQHNETIVRLLAQEWDETPKETSLPKVVEEATKIGLDAEKLAWCIIGYEAQHHIKLIWHEIHKLLRRYSERSAEDMFGYGWIGLRAAYRLYEPARGYKFSTYACQKISGAIRDGVRAEGPIPKRLTTFVRKAAKVEEDLAAELSRTPTLSELAQQLPEHVEQLKLLPRLAPAASIDEMLADCYDQGGDLPFLTSHEDPAIDAIKILRDESVHAALANLAPDEAIAARMLLLEGRTLTEARTAIGVSNQRLHELRDSATAQLREALSGWSQLTTA